MKTLIQTSLFCSLVAAVCSGCGPGEDPGAVPPPAPAAVPVTMTVGPETPPTSPATDSTQGGGVAGTAPAVAPGAAASGAEDIFKGMTPEQVEEFKATATPETHDTQIALISEAANTYYNEFKRAPASVEALVQAGHLPRVLRAPKGKKYLIDSTTLEVTSVNQ